MPAGVAFVLIRVCVEANLTINPGRALCRGSLGQSNRCNTGQNWIERKTDCWVAASAITVGHTDLICGSGDQHPACCGPVLKGQKASSTDLGDGRNQAIQRNRRVSRNTGAVRDGKPGARNRHRTGRNGPRAGFDNDPCTSTLQGPRGAIERDLEGRKRTPVKQADASATGKRPAVDQGRLLIERQERLRLNRRAGQGGCGRAQSLSVLNNRDKLAALNRAGRRQLGDGNVWHIRAGSPNRQGCRCSPACRCFARETKPNRRKAHQHSNCWGQAQPKRLALETESLSFRFCERAGGRGQTGRHTLHYRPVIQESWGRCASPRAGASSCIGRTLRLRCQSSRGCLGRSAWINQSSACVN